MCNELSYRFIAPSNQYFVAPRWNSSHPLSHGRNPFIVLSGSIFQIKSERILTDVVDAALSCGYRFFDTAQVYGNEAMLGRIFQELLPKYNLDRSDELKQLCLQISCSYVLQVRHLYHLQGVAS